MKEERAVIKTVAYLTGSPRSQLSLIFWGIKKQLAKPQTFNLLWIYFMSGAPKPLEEPQTIGK